MKRSAARTVVITSAVLSVACVCALLALRFSIRHHIEHLVDGGRAELPQATRLLAPIIGGEFASGSMAVFGAVLWSALLVMPLPMAAWAIRGQTPSEILIRWSAGVSLHLPLVAMFALATAFGLWLPFQFL